VLLAIVGGVAYDPAAVGAGTVSAAPASAGVAPTGKSTEMTISIEGMRFNPRQIQVPAGNTLTLTVVNGGDDVHDLVLETGQRTPRLSPGQSAMIDVGVVGRSLEGWCSVAGHRQMGMVFSIEVTDGSDATVAADVASAAGHDGHEVATGDEPVDMAELDLMSEPGSGTTIYDPRLPPAPATKVHRVRLVVAEIQAEVAPGVHQTRWTFGGTAPGPVLRGKVGDIFIVTLVNDGSIGHSIDFHAGALAPDGPMRTIAPGESLEYRFTATRAGIWMYHCSTMPMSMHIANGMFGAVIIDPPDLAPVDREFVLVQSESYLGPQGGTADAADIAAGQYDLVSFNGYPMQYDHAPLKATVGDRVRIWVLAAGPNVGSAFHVVGGQFDTVYREGAYDLLPAAGGSQVLGLFPAQGGFVELELPEVGTYPFVSHVMSDAEKGAHGLLKVSATN
jgi:nitrite reductase (NO-forming)